MTRRIPGREALWYLAYNLGFLVYLVASAPYYALHMILREHYRAGLLQRLGWLPAKLGKITEGRKKIWFHGVSVGEIQMLLELGEKWRAGAPDIHPIYSTTTLAAQRLAAKRLGPDRDIIYYPLDIPFAVVASLGKVKPSLVVLAETELWPNFIRACHRRGIPVILINGRISERSFSRYRWIRGFTQIFLGWIDHFLMQDEAYAQRIVELGAPQDRVQVTGNMKADAPGLQTGPSPELEKIFQGLRRGQNGKIFLAGSTHPGEERVLARLYRDWLQHIPDLVLVLAPRHLDRVPEVVQQLDAEGLRWARRSKANGAVPGQTEVLILDSLGELASAYRWADLVFIGKSLLSQGGQNPMEAARLARPIVFGPHMENFPGETRALLQADGAVQVADEKALRTVVPELLGNAARRNRLGENARLAVERLGGATQRNLAILEELMTALKSM